MTRNIIFRGLVCGISKMTALILILTSYVGPHMLIYAHNFQATVLYFKIKRTTFLWTLPYLEITVTESFPNMTTTNPALASSSSCWCLLALTTWKNS